MIFTIPYFPLPFPFGIRDGKGIHELHKGKPNVPRFHPSQHPTIPPTAGNPDSMEKKRAKSSLPLPRSTALSPPRHHCSLSCRFCCFCYPGSEWKLSTTGERSETFCWLIEVSWVVERPYREDHPLFSDRKVRQPSPEILLEEDSLNVKGCVLRCDGVRSDRRQEVVTSRSRHTSFSDPLRED